MGTCCLNNKVENDAITTYLSSEPSRIIRINSPVVKNKIGENLLHLDIASYTVLDSVFEYEVLDDNDESDSSLERKKVANGKGILKQITGKSLGSGGSSAGSSKKVSFCRTTTFFEKKSKKANFLES